MNEERFRLRYQLQAHARSLLGPGTGLWNCGRASTGGMVQICQAADKVWIGNVQTCKSVWSCPVCSSKISERRVHELERVIDKLDYPTLFLTLTFAHHFGDNLERLLDALYSSWRRFRQGRAWATLKEKYGWLADVRSTELTHGGNGWHPHLHILIWFRRDLTKWQHADLLHEIKLRWLESLRFSGAFAAYAYCATLVTTDDHVSRYLEKIDQWNIAREIGKYPVKIAQAAGRSPMQILVDSLGGDESAAELYKVYARRLRGRRQLDYSRSPDPRKLAGLDALEDEELEELYMTEAEQVFSIPWSDYRVLIPSRADFLLELRRAAALGPLTEDTLYQIWDFFATDSMSW